MSEEVRKEGVLYVPFRHVLQALEPCLGHPEVAEALEGLEREALPLPEDAAEVMDDLGEFLLAVRRIFVDSVVGPLKEVESRLRNLEESRGAVSADQGQSQASPLQTIFKAFAALLEACGFEGDSLEALRRLTEQADLVSLHQAVLRAVEGLAGDVEETIVLYQKGYRQTLGGEEIVERVEGQVQDGIQERVETLLRLLADEPQVPNEWARLECLPPRLKLAIERDVLL